MNDCIGCFYVHLHLIRRKRRSDVHHDHSKRHGEKGHLHVLGFGATRLPLSFDTLCIKHSLFYDTLNEWSLHRRLVEAIASLRRKKMSAVHVTNSKNDVAVAKMGLAGGQETKNWGTLSNNSIEFYSVTV